MEESRVAARPPVRLGLVSEAAAAKHRGQSQADAEAEADRAAATLAADETTAEAPTTELVAAPHPAAMKGVKGAKPAEKAVTEPVVEKPVAPPPAPKKSSKMLAPNPFGD